MPDFSSNIAFTVRFDLTIPDAPVLVLTDAGVGIPNGATGHFDITQPNGVTRFGSASTPDTTIGTNVSFRFPLSHAYALAWQLGSYTIVYTLSNAGYTDTLLTKTFTFNFSGLSLGLDEQFDLFTPLLKYADVTDYTVSGFSAPTISRSWAANSPATGALTSASSFIDLSSGGNYYSSGYSISLTSTATYTSSAYSYLSFIFIATESATTQTAIVPPSLALMLQWLTTFRKSIENKYDIDKENLYAYASGLYSEAKSVICIGGNDMDLVGKLYGATHRGASLTAKQTNMPLVAYDYSACGIAGNSTTPTALSITVQPQSATLTVGGNINISVTATGGTGTKTYQWFKGGTAINGATLSNYTITGAQTTDSGTFSVVVTDSSASTVPSANAVIVVNAVQIPALAIVTQPQGSTLTAGNPFTLAIGISGGTAPYSYVLKKNGTAFGNPVATSSTTNSVQQTPSSASTDTWQFVVTDSLNAVVTSNSVTVTVNAAVAPVGIFWGNDDAAPTTSGAISAGNSLSIAHNADITIPFTNTDPKICWFAEPVAETAKTYVYVTSLNQFAIASGMTYEPPTIVGGFRLYQSAYATSFDASPTFKKTQ